MVACKRSAQGAETRRTSRILRKASYLTLASLGKSVCVLFSSKTFTSLSNVKLEIGPDMLKKGCIRQSSLPNRLRLQVVPSFDISGHLHYLQYTLDQHTCLNCEDHKPLCPICQYKNRLVWICTYCWSSRRATDDCVLQLVQRSSNVIYVGGESVNKVNNKTVRSTLKHTLSGLWRECL
jgi:hypothetical protein